MPHGPSTGWAALRLRRRGRRWGPYRTMGVVPVRVAVALQNKACGADAGLGDTVSVIVADVARRGDRDGPKVARRGAALAGIHVRQGDLVVRIVGVAHGSKGRVADLAGVGGRRSCCC